ncbi:MAG TPA: YajQ family cyclic di-GMP-binding protein [Candidatus Megamonas gallistercoris]|nr:YajQ family cyclic di-GMP-binding protein [Candidatus Megamonas gallistercoris]
MAKDSSFDIVSQVNMQEMSNAVNQTEKEISQRYDFRGSTASIELEEKSIKIAAEDDYKLNAILDILRARMAKRGIPLRCLNPGKVEAAAKGTVRQNIEIVQGISKEKAKAITAAIKATKLKVNTQMQGDQVRVSGAKKDDLQAVIQTLKAGDFGIDLQFINMR